MVDQLSALGFGRGLLHRVTAAYVSTFPPRECGIATFTRDLTRAVHLYNPRAGPLIAAINDEVAIYNYGPDVHWQLSQHDLDSYREVATALSRSATDIVNIQHEFGIFGGERGSYVLHMLDHLRKPVVTTLHTVLPDPEPLPRQIVAALYDRSDAVVAMTPAAQEILRRDYGIDGRRLRIIPHGVPSVGLQGAETAKAQLGLAGRQVLSTFGLINSGKGIEDVIDALPLVVEKFPQVLYVVLGETHPIVRRSQGEEYRNQLVARAQRMGLQRHVRFYNRYLSDDELTRYLMATDIYITAYHNPNQIVSGTLSYALGCGRAIISTPYLYAQDALAEGRGILVPFRDPMAISEAVVKLLSDPLLRSDLQRKAYAHGKQMRWPRVAAAYLELFRQVLAHRTAVAS